MKIGLLWRSNLYATSPFSKKNFFWNIWIFPKQQNKLEVWKKVCCTCYYNWSQKSTIEFDRFTVSYPFNLCKKYVSRIFRYFQTDTVGLYRTKGCKISWRFEKKSVTPVITAVLDNKINFRIWQTQGLLALQLLETHSTSLERP